VAKLIQTENFIAREVSRDRKGHYIMMKGSILPEGLTTFDMYVLNKSVKMHSLQVHMKHSERQTPF
jgi:hypothetical protein